MGVGGRIMPTSAKAIELRNKYIELKSKRENEYIEELKRSGLLENKDIIDVEMALSRGFNHNPSVFKQAEFILRKYYKLAV